MVFGGYMKLVFSGVYKATYITSTGAADLVGYPQMDGESLSVMIDML